MPSVNVDCLFDSFSYSCVVNRESHKLGGAWKKKRKLITVIVKNC